MSLFLISLKLKIMLSKYVSYVSNNMIRLNAHSSHLFPSGTANFFHDDYYAAGGVGTFGEMIQKLELFYRFFNS